MRASVLVVALAAGAVPAQAFDGVRSEFAANRSIVTASRVVASDAITAASSSARAVAAVDLIGPGGRAIRANFAVTVARQGVARAAALAFGPVGFAVASGLLIYDVFGDSRIAPADAGGGLGFDTGQSTVGRVRYCGPIISGVPGGRFCGTPSGVALAHQAHSAASYAQSNYHAVILGPLQYPNGGLYYKFSVRNSAGVEQFQAGPFDITQTAVNVCPAYVDFFSSGSVAEGGASVGADGKCPTGRYTQPMTAEEAAAAVIAADTAATVDYARMMREAAGLGPVTIPADALQEFVEGTAIPAQIDGPEVVTQDATGTTTTVTKWDFSRDPLRKNEAAWKETKTTTKVDPQGNPVGTPTVTTTSPNTGDTSSDPCKGDPGRLGCIGTGEVADTELAEEERSVSVGAQAGWGLGTASCPAPQMVTVQGRSLVVDNTVLCLFLGGIRFVIVGLAFVGAAFIVLGGVKGE